MTRELGNETVAITNFRNTHKWPNNSYEEALAIYCDTLDRYFGVLPVMQHHIIDAAAESVSKLASQTHVIGVGGFGLRLAGEYNNLFGDGLPASHGLSANDADIFICSDNPYGTLAMQDGVNASISEILSDEKIAWWHLLEARWNEQQSHWGVPNYLKVKFFEHGGIGRWPQYANKGRETLHMHHEAIHNPTWFEQFLADYQPWQSNIIGAPMYYRNIADGIDSGHTIVNPFQTEENPEQHIVGLTTPADIFTKKPKSILQTTRVALGVVQAAFATEIPACIDKQALTIMREAVERHAGNLTTMQIAQAKKRLDTILFRAAALQNHFGYRLAKKSRSDFFTEYSLPNAQTQVIQILDQIGWGKAILGTEVDNYVKTNLEL